MSAYVPPSQLGQWIRTDLGVRTFQGLGKNAPLREQVVRRLTQDAHTHQILESLPCEPHLQVPLHCRCLPGCSYGGGCGTAISRAFTKAFFFKIPSLQTPPQKKNPGGVTGCWAIPRKSHLCTAHIFSETFGPDM